jgi:hypothetical protein
MRAWAATEQPVDDDGAEIDAGDDEPAPCTGCEDRAALGGWEEESADGSEVAAVVAVSGTLAS